MKGPALHLERRGRGPAVVLLHGFTGRGEDLAEVAQALEPEHETLAVDLPGHGRSVDAAVSTWDDCLRDLTATLRFAGHRRAHWLGYSMGARVALGCAVRHPECVASLVLVGGRAGIADPAERAARRRDDEALAVRIESAGVTAFVDEWMAQPMFATQDRRGPGFVAAQHERRLANDPRALAASLRALGPGAQPPLFAELPRVAVPVLLVVGALDGRFAAIAHDLAGRLPRAEVCEIADAGHAAHLEQPAAFVRAVRDFLRRAGAPAPSIPPFPVQETAS